MTRTISSNPSINRAPRRYLLYLLHPQTFLKSFYFNLHYFGLAKGMHFPVLVYRKVRIKNMRGSIVLEGKQTTGRIVIGFPHVPIFDERMSRTVWNHVGGEIRFLGTAKIGHGSKLAVNGYLEFGHHFEITAESTIVAYKKIIFGSDVLISWDVLIMDTDFHHVRNSRSDIINAPKEIKIGDHAWIGCRVTILKGASIPSDSIIAANSVVTKTHITPSSIYAGIPAVCIRENILWEH